MRSRANIEPSTALAESDIWSAATREELSVPRFTKYDLDKRRQKV